MFTINKKIVTFNKKNSYFYGKILTHGTRKTQYTDEKKLHPCV